MRLRLVLTVDPYDGESYGDVRYVCDDAHLDGVRERLRDAGFPPENIRVQSCAVNERIDWNV